MITRQENYQAVGCTIANNLEQAIAIAAELGNELCIAGGAEIYTLALPFAQSIYLTEVHQAFDGDAFFPLLDEAIYRLVSSENIQASIAYTHSVYLRR